MKKVQITALLILLSWFSSLVITSNPAYAQGIQASNPAEMKMMDMLKSLKGDDFDKMFLQMMVPHHQAAVDMSASTQANAHHAEIKTLAKNITTAQQKEIAQMNGWLKTWYNAVPDPSMDMGPGMSAEDMQKQIAALKTLTGDAYDKQYMIDMIPHHQAAIEMAKLVPERAKHQELKDLAQNITQSQSSEIDGMTNWLNNWYKLNAQGQPVVQMPSTGEGGPQKFETGNYFSLGVLATLFLLTLITFVSIRRKNNKPDNLI